MKILLTNDDSHRSPLLKLAFDAVSALGEVTVVVPKHEQSWKGKSLTRFGYLHLENADLFPVVPQGVLPPAKDGVIPPGVLPPAKGSEGDGCRSPSEGFASGKSSCSSSESFASGKSSCYPSGGFAFGKRRCYTVDGTPADCVNIAIHHLFKDRKPDLVVSGINAGLNAGTGFILSSGTVGACLEANICGVPAIALSQHFDVDTREQYINSYSIPAVTLQRLELQTEDILKRIFSGFWSNKTLLDMNTTWNINLPFIANDSREIRVTHMGKSVYGACYRLVDSFSNSGEANNQIMRFEHHLVEYTEDDSEDCDSRVLAHGCASINPISLHSLGQLAKDRREELQRSFPSSRKDSAC